MASTLLTALLALAALVPMACSGSGATSRTSTATGGAKSTGGTTANGGTTATGGATANGGTTTTGGTTGAGGTNAAGGTTPTGGTTATGGNRQDAGADRRADSASATGGATATGGTSATGGATGGATGTGGARQDAGADARADSASATGGVRGTGGTSSTGGISGTGGATQDAGSNPTCTVPAASAFKLITSVGGGGSSYKESDHFAVFGASSPDATLNFLEAANQCFVDEWCWRSAGLSITESSGTPYKLNVYAVNLSGAAGVMQYDRTAGLSYLEVVPGSIGNSGVVVHEFGHALTLAQKGWVDQGRTGLWWESVANFVADTFHTSPICAKARTDRGIATGKTIIDLAANISNSFNIIVMNGNHYEAWPFLAYLTYNPDNYAGLGKMVLLNMFTTHKRNNETPLHVLERLSAPITVQAIVGRYWARMAYIDIGHPTAQEVFLSGRSRLNYANLTASGTGTYTPITARQPKYCGSNIIPLKVGSDGAVSVEITNLGNSQTDSDFTATLVIRPSSGAIRYVDLPNGSGSATVATGEEATLVVANTPKTLYLYDPSNIGASDPANAGLNYKLQLTGATPAN